MPLRRWFPAIWSSSSHCLSLDPYVQLSNACLLVVAHMSIMCMYVCRIFLAVPFLVCPAFSWSPSSVLGSEESLHHCDSWHYLLSPHWPSADDLFICYLALPKLFFQKKTIKFCQFALKPLWLHFAYRINFDLLGMSPKALNNKLRLARS